MAVLVTGVGGFIGSATARALLERGDAVVGIDNLNDYYDPRLKQATILADPDYLVEAMPYYVGNSAYLIREQRFGNVVRFTKDARLEITLDDILNEAIKLRSSTGEPVLILLSQKLAQVDSVITRREGYNWKLHMTPEQARSFTGRARLLAEAATTAGDESYDVYLLDQ